MKQLKRAAAVFAFALLITVSAATPKGNTLLKNASPDTSALTLYCYDGSAVTCKVLYDGADTKKILQSLSSADAQKTGSFTPAQTAVPIYGITIGGKDGNPIQAAWSNGFWIAQDGTAYRFDYDFEALDGKYAWDETDTLMSTAALPCARILCQDASGWNKSLLTPAEPPNPPDQISASLVSMEQDVLTVSFENQGKEEWAYGEYFALHVLIDGVWYVVPPVPGSWGFCDIAHILPAQSSQEQTYTLNMYGSLPDGSYRLTAENLAVEFELP